MRQSKLFIPTLREAPTDAEAASHKWMLRAGYIRQLAAGVYSYLPLGLRVLKKIEAIIRDEMERIDAQEVLLPAMQPAELWRASGRYSIYGAELVRFHDRNDREFALGPTHEEVITSLVQNEVNTYRKLPITLYQIQTKFRDERRPRFGLLRGREFLMKDAYSFDKDWEGLNRSYQMMYNAYHTIFTRCELNYRAVRADAGAIGGEGETHEFMVLAEIGEDTVVTCTQCEYAANFEKAEAALVAASNEGQSDIALTIEKLYTPEVRTIRQLIDILKVEAEYIIKTLIYLADGDPIAVLIRGDHEANEVKIKNYVGAEHIELADADTTLNVTGAPVGFAGPVGLTVPILVDREVAAMNSGIIGANERDYHLRNVKPGREFGLEQVGDFRNVTEGDRCVQCSAALTFYQGIEVGHVFKLGSKYSGAMGATYSDASGQELAMIMGCYGIGVSRILSAAVEQNHDESGIVWPVSLAPFQVHLIPVSLADQAQMSIAEQMYERFQQAGVEILMDDREERAGVKFNDSDLIGIPFRITIGKRSNEGIVELKERDSKEVLELTMEDAIERVLVLLGK